MEGDGRRDVLPVRSAIVDIGSQPYRNLFKDPRAASGDFNRYWRNSRWFGAPPGAGVYSWVAGATDGPPGISTYARKTWTVATAGPGSNGDTGFEINRDPDSPVNVGRYFSCKAGDVFTVFYWM